MDNDTDQKYQYRAIEALDRSLSDFECNQTLMPSDCSKNEIVDIYFKSRNIVQSNPDNEFLATVANSVFYTCIRLVRCLFLSDSDAKETIINGNTVILNAQSLYTCMQTEFKRMESIQREL